jgi:hypothetical protein
MMLARQFAIAMSIAILFPMAVYYGVSTIHPYPEFHYGYRVTARLAPTTPEGWKAWDEENQVEKKRQKERQDAIDKATQPFFRALIFVATPLGIAAILVGSYLRIVSIGTGFIFGGIVIVANGYRGYWNHLDDWVRFVSLFLGLCILVFVGYRQFLMARNTPT